MAGERTRQEPSFARGLGVLLGAPTQAAGTYTREAARVLNTQGVTSVLDELMADALATSAVPRLLNLGTPKAVHQL